MGGLLSARRHRSDGAQGTDGRSSRLPHRQSSSPTLATPATRTTAENHSRQPLAECVDGRAPWERSHFALKLSDIGRPFLRNVQHRQRTPTACAATAATSIAEPTTAQPVGENAVTAVKSAIVPQSAAPARRRAPGQHGQAETTSAIIASNAATGVPRILVDITVGRRSAKVNALPDTGADVSIGGEDLLQQLGLQANDISQPSLHPRAANGTTLRSVGVIRAVITLDDASVEEEVHILPEVSGLLMSWGATRRLRLVPADYPCQISAMTRPCVAEDATRRGTELGPLPSTPAVDITRSGNVTSPPPRDATRLQTVSVRPPEPDHHPKPSEYSELPHLTREYEKVFHGHIRTMPGQEFAIHLQHDARPFCVTAPRRIPLSLREPLKAELEQLEGEGVIRRVTAPTVVRSNRGRP